MYEDVRKPMTFLAVVFIFLALALGWNRVTAMATFGADFANGKDRGHINGTMSSQDTVYKVEYGDSWAKIARDHGVSTRALLEVNNANIGTDLVPGQNIQLPGATKPAASASAGTHR